MFKTKIDPASRDAALAKTLECRFSEAFAKSKDKKWEDMDLFERARNDPKRLEAEAKEMAKNLEQLKANLQELQRSQPPAPTSGGSPPAPDEHGERGASPGETWVSGNKERAVKSAGVMRHGAAARQGTGPAASTGSEAAVPEDIPADVRLPDGATVVESHSLPRGVMLTLETSASADEVLGDIRGKMAESGWREGIVARGDSGGKAVYEKAGRGVVVTVKDRPGRNTRIELLADNQDRAGAISKLPRKTAAARQQEVVVSAGAAATVPEDFPDDVRLFDGAAIKESISTPETTSLVMETESSVDEVLSSFRKDMVRSDWVEELAQQQEDRGTAFFSKGKRMAKIEVTGKPGRGTRIELTASKQTRR